MHFKINSDGSNSTDVILFLTFRYFGDIEPASCFSDVCVTLSAPLAQPPFKLWTGLRNVSAASICSLRSSIRHARRAFAPVPTLNANHLGKNVTRALAARVDFDSQECEAINIKVG